MTTPFSHDDCLCFVKIECDPSMEPGMMKKLIVRSDLTWHTYIKSLKINSDSSYFSSLPQAASSLSSLNQIVVSVDSCTLCAGNDDNDFHVLIAAKKHGFTDVSGKYKNDNVHYIV